MKGVRVIMNSILMIFTAGLIFLSGVSDGRPSPGSVYSADFLRDYFIRVQGVTFIAIVSCIMTGIFSVSLACKLFIIAVPNDR